MNIRVAAVFSCTVVPRKGAFETDVAVQFMLESIADLGSAHSAVHAKNEHEPAIEAVR